MPDPITGDLHYREGFSDPAPYPALQVQGKNPYYARLLMEDYAGPSGEMTAANQYIYHHTMTDSAPEAADVLENISIVEMMHMEKLAKTIRLLGVDPHVKGGPEAAAWTSGSIQYGLTLAQRLHLDLASEYEAIYNYEKHIRMIDDPYIKALLRRIVLDEQLHVKHFKQLICRFDQES